MEQSVPDQIRITKDQPMSSLENRTTPTHVLDGDKLDELELLLGGLCGESRVYSLPGDPTSVLASRRDEMPAEWRSTLEVPAQTAGFALKSGFLHLTDSDGTPLARLKVESNCSGRQTGTVFLAGSLTALQPPEHPPARHLRITEPVQKTNLGCPTVVAAFSELPAPEDIAAAAGCAGLAGAELILVALQASARSRSHAFYGLIEALERCAAVLPRTSVRVLVVPGSTPTAGPAEGGRTRFILESLQAQHLLDFTRPPSHAQAPAGVALAPAEGIVILLTGLSGSGKSTLARALAERLQVEDRRAVTVLDGDEVRRFLSADLGFSREDRETNVERIGWVASLIARTSGIAICAPIAPFDSTRQRVRELAAPSGRFLLVHVATPLEVCEARDRKGLYAKARAGIVTDFTGLDSPYEIPHDADLIIDTSVMPVDQAVTQLVNLINGR